MTGERCEDTFRHKGLRRRMLESLCGGGFDDARVLAAMNEVPRHYFFDTALAEVAYSDVAVPIAGGQTISQPSTVAWQTHLLQVEAGDLVLEIGTGSGYQAAVLCALGAELFSIERQQVLHRMAGATLARMGYRPHLVWGDGFEGLPEYAPFSKIIVTCGADRIPDKLVEQLAVGGRMVLPLADGAGGLQMQVLVKRSATECEMVRERACSFVPMLVGVAP